MIFFFHVILLAIYYLITLIIILLFIMPWSPNCDHVVPCNRDTVAFGDFVLNNAIIHVELYFYFFYLFLSVTRLLLNNAITHVELYFYCFCYLFLSVTRLLLNNAIIHAELYFYFFYLFLSVTRLLLYRLGACTGYIFCFTSRITRLFVACYIYFLNLKHFLLMPTWRPVSVFTAIQFD